jgi:hypothetical protein
MASNGEQAVEQGLDDKMRDPTEDTDGKVGERLALSKELSSLKRSITNQIKILVADLKQKEPVSRTSLRRKDKRLDDTLNDLLKCAANFKRLDLNEKDQRWIEDYIDTERNQVINISGEVSEHIDARSHEPSTSFGDDQVSLAEFKTKQRLQIAQERNETQELIGAHDKASERAKQKEQVLQMKLEALELGTRALDFQEETAINQAEQHVRKGAEPFQS